MEEGRGRRGKQRKEEMGVKGDEMRKGRRMEERKEEDGSESEGKKREER